MQRIFVYLISLSSILLCLPVNTVMAQKKKQITVPADSTRWLNGFTVNVDVASLVTSTFVSNGIYSSEAGIQLDLKHKFFPTLELGVAGANKVSNDNINFKTNGVFERFGIDFNLRKKKPDSKPTNNLFTAGIRLGMSNFNYNVTNVSLTDTYWGGTEIINYPTQNTTKLWYEFVVGVQVEVIRNLYLGWNLRVKNMLSKDITGAVSPWYIPGFGQNNASNYGFNYTLGYHFFQQKKSVKKTPVILIEKKDKSK